MRQTFNLGYFSNLITIICFSLYFVICMVSSSRFSPLTLMVVGAPQMTMQQYLSTSPCFQRISKLHFSPVHSWMLSFHLFFCLPLLLALFNVPRRTVFAIPEDLEMWTYHLSFRFFPMVRSSCTLIAFWIQLRTSSFVTWSSLEIFKSLL